MRMAVFALAATLMTTTVFAWPYQDDFKVESVSFSPKKATFGEQVVGTVIISVGNNRERGGDEYFKCYPDYGPTDTRREPPCTVTYLSQTKALVRFVETIDHVLFSRGIYNLVQLRLDYHGPGDGLDGANVNVENEDSFEVY